MKTSIPSLFIATILTGLIVLPARAQDTILHNFTGGISDGSGPLGSLTLSGSKLYGLTTYGGSSDQGTIFSVNTDGTGFSLLHNFTGGINDGRSPLGSLTVSGSKLYGLTTYGGSSSAFGDGTIFSINSDGTGFSLVHSFTSGVSDGRYPKGSLTVYGARFYGATFQGGSNGNLGTIFSMNPDGTGFSLLHSFGSPGDGANPSGSLTFSGSKFYGMTGGDGSSGGLGTGTIFSINSDGTGYTLVQHFSGSPGDGSTPQGDVTVSADGQTLYGMTYSGGIGGKGVVFSVPIGAVPEPSALAMIALAFPVLLGTRRLYRCALPA